MPKASAPARAGAPRVLVVKDRMVSGQRYHRELRASGLDVTDVFHGREALAAVLGGGQDLFLFEVRCDRYGGEDPTLLHVLRRYLDRPDVPVILASFFPERWTADRRRELGVSEVLPRPISSPAEVVRAARRALGLADPAGQPRAPGPASPARRVA